MSEWPSFTVAELQHDGVLLVEDGNHGEYRPRPDEFVEGGTSFVRAADLVDGQVAFASAGTINEVALDRVRKGIGRPNDILFSHKGTVGKLARVPADAPPFVCSPQTTFWRVLDESRIRRDYLYAFMRSRTFINQWWVRKGETDMADYVSLTAQRQLRVTVPPLGTQIRIAEPLAALDDLIENNRRRVELLEQMAQAIYREWFVHFRFPGHEDATFVDSPNGPIPEKWRAGQVGDLVKLKKKTLDPADIDADTPAVGLEHIPRKRLTLDSWGIADGLASRKATFARGDVLFGKIRPYFHKVAVAPMDGICSTDCMVFAPADGYRGLATFALFDEEFVAHVANSANGTKMPRANWDVMRDYAIPVPPVGLSQMFDRIAQPAIEEAERLMLSNRELASMRDLLLPKLVTGQIDVSGLDLDALVESVA